MSLETLFSVCNLAVIPAWLLLALVPRWEWTQRLVHAAWIPIALALVYGWALFASPTAPEGAGFSSLAGVMALFTSPQAVLAGWIHYLVFDLFVGAWEVRDAARHRIPHGLLLPCLFFTFMLGPIGLALYLVLRAALRREFAVE